MDEITDTDEVGQYTGQVKWWNDMLGYGFATIVDGEEKGRDVFIHHTGIRTRHTNYRTLLQGEYVNFDITQSQNGVQAMRVTGVCGGSLMCEQKAWHKSMALPSVVAVAAASAGGGNVSTMGSVDNNGTNWRARHSAPSPTPSLPLLTALTGGTSLMSSAMSMPQAAMTLTSSSSLYESGYRKHNHDYFPRHHHQQQRWMAGAQPALNGMHHVYSMSAMPSAAPQWNSGVTSPAAPQQRPNALNLTRARAGFAMTASRSVSIPHVVSSAHMLDG